MRADTRREVKQTARKLYRDGRISLEMAVWAMKNAGYTREETAEWLELTEENRDGRNNENKKNYAAFRGRELPRK
jgi:Asp-tRNA(Asn)/Glu-tRNA(Gln) amidotransferase B subunit